MEELKSLNAADESEEAEYRAWKLKQSEDERLIVTAVLEAQVAMRAEAMQRVKEERKFELDLQELRKPPHFGGGGGGVAAQV